jgi:hypothetical protein
MKNGSSGLGGSGTSGGGSDSERMDGCNGGGTEGRRLEIEIEGRAWGLLTAMACGYQEGVQEHAGWLLERAIFLAAEHLLCRHLAPTTPDVRVESAVHNGGEG